MALRLSWCLPPFTLLYSGLQRRQFFLRKRFAAAGLASLFLSSAAVADGPGLGRVATPEEIAAWDISVGPDGSGLPSGGCTAQQGAAVFAEKCVAFGDPFLA